MALIGRIIWQIESNLNADLSLALLADRCAVSQHHMCRAFQQTTGLGIMAYVRARRLSQAAIRIAAGQTDILTIALDSGYGSHEAFTRAFSALFGLLPSTIAKARSTETLTLTRPFPMKQDMIVDVAPHRIETHPAFSVTGLAQNFTFEENSGIPALWQRFSDRMDELSGTSSDVFYGVCFNADASGNFRYISGVNAANRPKGMETVDLPEQKYAVFTHDGHISDFSKMVYSVWNKTIPDARLAPAYGPDFERYDSRFNAETGYGIVEVWIPIT